MVVVMAKKIINPFVVIVISYYIAVANPVTMSVQWIPYLTHTTIFETYLKMNIIRL
jgi:hypothetical protein